VALLAVAVVVLVGCAMGSTGSATDVTDTSATLEGSVLSNRTEDATYWFEYGTTEEFGTKTPTRTVSVPQNDGRSVSEPVSGLTPDTTYHYRLCAKGTEENVGEVCGERRTFTTEPTQPTRLSISAQPPLLLGGFDAAKTDYVTRCENGPVRVTVGAPAGTDVAVDGQAPRSGRFSQTVALGSGQRFGFSVAGPGGTSAYHVRCLPTDFPAWTFSRSAQPTQEWVLVTPTVGNARYVSFFDRNGVPVWWYRPAVAAIDGKLLADNTLAFARFHGGGFEVDPAGAYEIRRLDGTLVRTLATVGAPTDFHDFQPLANGNHLLLSYKARDHVDLSAHGGPADATMVDAEIQEQTAAGAVVWSWNSKDHIALAETDGWWDGVLGSPRTLPDGRVAYDPVHINAIEPDGAGLLVSFRHTDAIYRINRGDGHVEWKLGGTTTPESLTLSGDPNASPLDGQHDVRRLADGTVSVFDNGTRSLRRPRVVRYQINAAARTASLVESLSDGDVSTSVCCGGARRLPTGGWLVAWGGTPTYAEYASGGSRIFRLDLKGTLAYRAFPVATGRIAAAALRQGMDTMFPR
jgi:hypothetical protein